MREDVKKGRIKSVICYKPDRWSRDLANALIVTKEIKSRAEIQFVEVHFDDSPMGMFFFQILGATAELDKAIIKQRTMDGRKSKARSGKVVKEDHTYGYTFNKEKGTREINEQEAEIVRLIFDLFINPQKLAELAGDRKYSGLNGIALFLTARGVPTKTQIMFEAGLTKKRARNGWVWHKQVVKQIIENASYKGEFYQNRYNTEGILGNKFRDKEDHVQMTERPREEWIRVPCPIIVDEMTFIVPVNY
ncbi:recombinase family protein [Candidatus Pristimantibacillus sp. PTI5]|uniref:recombinase family protein n=1 Tax=Candidatus Pristimantibacillus sp. PTI5 TaxID=3400422 RepID=UPI003B01EDD8